MRSDAGSKRPNYDNSRREAKARDREYSLLVKAMLEQIEAEEQIHPETYSEAMKHIEKAFFCLEKVLLHLKRAEVTFNETPRVRNQRLRRRRAV